MLEKLVIGKIEQGTVKVNDEVCILNYHEPDKKVKIRVTKLYEYEGLERVEVKESTVGSIVAVSGMPRYTHWRHYCRYGQPYCFRS